MPHHLAKSKDPKARIAVINDAGRAKIPTTTGILLGIGENEEETVRSLEKIRELHRRHGHIQEVIIQNFVPKPQTIMGKESAPERTYFARTVALARIMMPSMYIPGERFGGNLYALPWHHDYSYCNGPCKIRPLRC